MDVELPSTGCNIIRNSESFYNFSTDGRTRETYYIFDGKAVLESTNYNQYGYSYTGQCLSTGDLVYKPELKEVFFPLISIVLSLLLFYGAYKLMLSHWWRYK